MEHLTRLVEPPHVNVRVVPTRIGVHPGLHGGFTLCVMPRPYPPVVMVSHLDSRLMIEADGAHRYADAFDKLREVSFSPAESAALIATIADEAVVSTRAA